ncbi:Hsp70 family protein [Egbenema bharatensis]|uniref:Hsp70 family protein n=1 Tax=Egbenema bharatensis TaxID=3463334 RepID=UPI003A8A0ED0
MTITSIDFGTSNTLVSILEPATQTPKTLRFPGISRVFKMVNPQGEGIEIPVVPSIAFAPSPGEWLVGQQVRSQRLGFAQPDRLFKTFKRDLVADFQPPSRQIDGYSYSTETVSEQFLRTIWQAVLQQVQPSQVIFTVPVGAFERYLDWFRETADRLGITHAQFIDESTAAALGYAVQRPGSLVLVIDFGGGTLDLSLVRTTAISGHTGGHATVQQAEVLAKADAYIGGEDIDGWIVEDYLQTIGLSREKLGETGWQTLLGLAERLKIRLSQATEAKESWLDESTFTAHEWHLTRSQFDQLLESRQFLEQLRQSLDDLLAIALSKGIGKGDIAQVLLVGGSCLIPAVQQLILSYFGRQKVRLNKPFEAVVHGALSLHQLRGIQDYLHHSYAIRVWEPFTKTYSYLRLFEKGTAYPCKRPDRLTLQAAIDGQTEIRLDVGEVADITHAEVLYDAQGRMTSTTLHQNESYRSLNASHETVCMAKLDPPGQVGIDRISVEFEVNDQRLLLATVWDLLTQATLVERTAIAKLQ